MKVYELTYIITSVITLKEADALIKEIEIFVQNKEGVILKSEKTTAQTLAYPIKKQSSGYFVFLTFQISEDKIKEIKEKLEKDIKILRHFIMVKEPIKELRERRIRKPLTVSQPETTTEFSFSASSEQNLVRSEKIAENNDKKKGEKVELDEMEKKLDEILNE